MTRNNKFGRGLPGRNSRRKVSVIFCTALPLLIWRLLDLLGEISDGPIKMSLGPNVVTGNTATALQLLVILVLAYLVTGSAHTIRHPEKQESIP